MRRVKEPFRGPDGFYADPRVDTRDDPDEFSELASLTIPDGLLFNSHPVKQRGEKDQIADPPFTD
jgi:hypothetical protein